MDGKVPADLTIREAMHLFVHEWGVDGSALDGMYFLSEALGPLSPIVQALGPLASANDTRGIVAPSPEQ